MGDRGPRRLELWLDWEQGSKGMQQLVWSRGLKERVGVDEKQDEEIVAEDEQGATIAVLPARTWRQVYPWPTRLLHAVETGGVAGATPGSTRAACRLTLAARGPGLTSYH